MLGEADATDSVSAHGFGPHVPIYSQLRPARSILGNVIFFVAVVAIIVGFGIGSKSNVLFERDLLRTGFDISVSCSKNEEHDTDHAVCHTLAWLVLLPP
jgi:hypothetical protein